MRAVGRARQRGNAYGPPSIAHAGIASRHPDPRAHAPRVGERCAGLGPGTFGTFLSRRVGLGLVWRSRLEAAPPEVIAGSPPPARSRAREIKEERLWIAIDSSGWGCFSASSSSGSRTTRGHPLGRSRPRNLPCFPCLWAPVWHTVASKPGAGSAGSNPRLRAQRHAASLHGIGAPGELRVPGATLAARPHRARMTARRPAEAQCRRPRFPQGSDPDASTRRVGRQRPRPLPRPPCVPGCVRLP